VVWTDPVLGHEVDLAAARGRRSDPLKLAALKPHDVAPG
jgi:hypothetical protein